MAKGLTDPITMLVRHAGDVRIHTFLSSFTDGNIANATHIIESEHELVLVDAQFLAPYATLFRSYADSLDKPIARLYLTHRHPDHWFGIGTAFQDVPIYALPETKDFIAQKGQESLESHKSKLPADFLPKQIVVPQEIVKLGAETIDGVEYVFSKLVDTEIDFHLIVELPKLRTTIVQDLIYSGTHLYLTKDFANWTEALGEMLRSENDLFLAGHGLPADKIEVARNVEYLIAAKAAIDGGLQDDAFREYMVKRYPERKCDHIFDIYMPRLFHGAADH